MKCNLHGIAGVLHSLGYKGKELVQENFCCVESATNGRGFAIFPLNAEGKSLTDADAEAGLIRFRAAWYNMVNLVESEMDRLCNWFNEHRSFSKLYRTTSNESIDLAIEADLYVPEGMPEAFFEARVRAFIDDYEYVMRNLPNLSFIDREAIAARHDEAVSILHGGTGDPDKAINLYRINANLGFAGSQNNFGDLFESGEVVPRDDVFAMYWYARAAERGEPTAYFSLASLLERSRDNTDALIVATQYAILASDSLPEGKNKTAAAEIRDALKHILDPALYETAEKYAREFRPLYRERDTLSDAPGSPVSVVPGSGLVN